MLTRQHGRLQILWALCVYLEAVSVLPQLRMMQNAKVVEKFTAHYVFALGLSRFVSCAHWVLQVGDFFLCELVETSAKGRCTATAPAGMSALWVPSCTCSLSCTLGAVKSPAHVVCASLQIIDGDSFLLQAIGSGLWPAMVLLSEIVQTFILADFW